MRRIAIAIVALATALGAAADGLRGKWNGTLQAGGMKLRLSVSVRADSTATLDSPDQGTFGLPAQVQHLGADSLSLALPQLQASYNARLKDGRLCGTFRQGMLSLPLDMERAQLERPQTPMPPFPYVTEEVVIPNASAGVTLAGTLTLPENFDPAQTPVVVMVTGSGLQNRDEELFGHRPFAVIADYLARHGIASLRYDDRGKGASTGDGAAATTTDFASDARAAIEALRSRGCKRVGILGHSEGAAIAFQLAAKKVPEFIVAIGAPGVQGYEILVDQTRRAMADSGVAADMLDRYCEALTAMYRARISDGADAAKAAVLKATASWQQDGANDQLKAILMQLADNGNPWLDEFMAYDPRADIAATACPALAIYGSLDTQVPPAQNAPAAQANHAVAVKTYPGLNHLMQSAKTGKVSEYEELSETFSPTVLADIATFINSLE